MLHVEVLLCPLQTHDLCASSTLSTSSQAKLATLQSPLRARQFILGRQMLAKAAERLLGQPYALHDIAEGEFFPYLQQAPYLHGSISHSGNYLAVTLNHERVGLDIESCRYKNNIGKLAQFALHPKEASWVCAAPEAAQERFYLLWTLREAAYKAGLRQQVIRGDSLIMGEQIEVDWHWASCRTPEQRISIATASPCTMVLIHNPPD
jgi:4'-phosphopantetheinyl transferase